MVTYRSITVLLRSHFDPLQCIPEFTAPPAEEKPTAKKSDELTPVVGSSNPVFDPGKSEVSVYIPSLSAGQFSIDYAVAPPQPDSMHFYFKLFIEGKHIVSWGVGKDQDYRGRTTFALYDTPRGTRATRIFERRSFFLSNATPRKDESKEVENGYPHLQICVYRAESRRRIPPVIEKFKKSAVGKAPSNGIKLVNAGTQKWHPQRFYEFLLIDPPLRPFADFNYYIKPWEQLNHLGFVPTELAPSQIMTTPLTLDGTRGSLDSSSKLQAANTEKPLSQRYHRSRFTEHCSPWGEYTSDSENNGKSLSEILKKLWAPQMRNSLRPGGIEPTKPEVSDPEVPKQLSPILECESAEAISSPVTRSSKSPEMGLRSETSSASSRALPLMSRRIPRLPAGNNTVRDGILRTMAGKWKQRKSDKSET